MRSRMKAGRGLDGRRIHCMEQSGPLESEDTVSQVSLHGQFRIVAHVRYGRRCSLSLVLCLALAACAELPLRVNPYVAPPAEFERVSVNNYELNHTQRANVGESMVRAKHYTVKKGPIGALTPRTDVGMLLSAGGGQFALVAGVHYPIVGVRMARGVSYRVVRVGGVHILVTEDGRIEEGTVLGPQYAVIVYRLSTNPSPAYMDPVVSEVPVAEWDFTNFEIIYTGRTHDSLRFSYREYTPQDLARPAFYQELTYPADTEYIRHKALRIQIEEATNESITYRVVEDGSDS